VEAAALSGVGASSIGVLRDGVRLRPGERVIRITSEPWQCAVGVVEIVTSDDAGCWGRGEGERMPDNPSNHARRESA